MEDGKEAKETIMYENSMEEDTVLEEEGGISVCQTTSGTFSDSGGLRWIYDESTCTLTITDEDEGITEWNVYLPDVVYINVNKIVFQDCVAIGSMESMFSWCGSLESVDVSGLDTSQVRSMNGMFSGCSNLVNVDVSGFDTSQVTSMYDMFKNCEHLESVDISGFDISSVTDMQDMFFGCSRLTTIATPQVMVKGQSIKLPIRFEDSQKNIVSEITSAHCNKILTRVKGYDITYHLDGGKNHVDNPATYNESSSTITLKEPEKTGYTFKGWYSDSKFTKKVKTIPKGSEGNKTLYAKWTANKYNIAFKGNGNTGGSMKKMSDCKYGKSYTLSKNAFKRTGYTFEGWYSDSSYKNQVKTIKKGSTGDVKLYAK